MRWLLLAGVAQPARKAAGKRDEQVPDSGGRVVEECAGLEGYGREEEVDGGGCKADDHLERQAGGGVAKKPHVGRGNGVGDGEHRAHKRADEHGTYDSLGGVRVEANRGYEHGDNEDAHVRAIELRATYEAFADLRPGSAAFSHVKGAPEAVAPRRAQLSSALVPAALSFSAIAAPRNPGSTYPYVSLVHSCAPKVGQQRCTRVRGGNIFGSLARIGGWDTVFRGSPEYKSIK